LVFSRRLTYVVLDATKPEGFKRLAKTVDPDAGLAIFLSTAPTLFKAVIDGLEAVGLTGPRVRLALEKPLGTDLASSRVINDAVAIAFPESRTFRIDHYLGKETVQNLLALRFANSMFEPLWNSAHIDHVQITVAESIGLEERGAYYDGAGALRDMVQNHMLQLLALVAMEPPADFDATEVRDERSGAALAAADAVRRRCGSCRHRPIWQGARSGASRSRDTLRNWARIRHRNLRRT
jgi:glucose-6-phosphate 1-dehydrogenase